MFDSLVDKIRTSKPYLEDKWQIRLSLLVRCIKIRFLLSKWRKCMNIHWAKTKFKIEWESSYPVKHILGDPFFVFMCSLHLVFYPKFPGFWPWSPGFWSFGVERSAVSYGTMLTWTLAWPVRKAFTLTWNQIYASDTSRNPLQSCLVFPSIFNLLLKTAFGANFDS